MDAMKGCSAGFKLEGWLSKGYYSSVGMYDAEEFIDFITFKYDETSDAWL